jgi:hypothetical protein
MSLLSRQNVNTSPFRYKVRGSNPALTYHDLGNLRPSDKVGSDISRRIRYVSHVQELFSSPLHQ